MTQTITGTVKFFNFRKGFGFIAKDDKPEGEEDLFVHATSVKGNPLKDGDKVEFEEGTDEKTGKPCATNVTGGSGYPSRKGKGRGKGRREGDWECADCADVVCFGTKDHCFKCNKPRSECEKKDETTTAEEEEKKEE